MVNINYGPVFLKCIPYLNYIRITFGTTEVIQQNRISKTVVASDNIHFNIGVSDLNTWQSVKLTALGCTFNIPFPPLERHLQYSVNDHSQSASKERKITFMDQHSAGLLFS